MMNKQNDTTNIIEVNTLSFSYMRDVILKDMSFEIASGAFLVIAGPNGAGKTTLLNLLCGQLKCPATGSIKIDGAKINSYSTRKLAQKIAVVRQEFVPVFNFTATQIVSMARTPYIGMLGFESEIDKQKVQQALEITGITQFANRPLGQLSGGERQRVFIARAFAQDTDVLLLDEPTSFLDLKHQVEIYDLLKQMQIDNGKTIVAVSHDINLAVQYADMALLLSRNNDYNIGEIGKVLSCDQIEKTFDVKVFSGKIGRENFYLPLGNLAKDRKPVDPHTK